MDTIRSLLHDGHGGLPEVWDLLPQRLQTGQVVVQVDDCDLGTWMHLGDEKKRRWK